MSKFFAIASLVLVTTMGQVQAGIISVPVGLNPGDQFRVVFVTSQVRDAVALNIADYNSFVDGVAGTLSLDGATDLEWKAIASTVDVDARDNINANTIGGAPFYTVVGDLVALNNQDLWDGTISTAIGFDESGSLVDPFIGVWTGTEFGGASGTGNNLGGPFPVEGFANRTNSQWVNFGTTFGNLDRRFYGASEVLTVPDLTATVPEPSSFAMLSVLGGAGFVVRRKRNAR